MEKILQYTYREPFALSIVKVFHSHQEVPGAELQPIGNREFFATSALILIAFGLFAWFVGSFSI